VPVRITLDPQELVRYPLRIGLSTETKVDVHDVNGQQLAQTTPSKPVLATSAYDVDRSEIRAKIARIIRDNTLEDSPPGGH
jgi:membrane fusion protein (multidrug efflux system)